MREYEALQEARVKDVLLSYWYSKGQDLSLLQQYGFTRTFLDSGAFSAMTKKVHIDIDKYVQYIKDTQAAWTTYAALDVVGDSEATAKNQAYMESQGLHPLPTFHYPSDFAELERMLERYNHIAFGGLVPIAMQQPRMQAWLDACFSRVIKRGKPYTRVHGFGINAMWAWKRYPFYSVDATSWKQGMRYGRTSVAKGLDLKETGKKDTELGYLLWHKDKDWGPRTVQNIKSYATLAERVTALWTERGIQW